MTGWKQIGLEIGLILLKVFFLLIVLGAAWVAYDLVKDGYDAFFMTFESEPKEGLAYWHQKRLHETLLSNSVPIGVTFLLSGALVWSLCRSFGRLMKIP